jgi:hypothetical protein
MVIHDHSNSDETWSGKFRTLPWKNENRMKYCNVNEILPNRNQNKKIVEMKTETEQRFFWRNKDEIRIAVSS